MEPEYVLRNTELLVGSRPRQSALSMFCVRGHLGVTLLCMPNVSIATGHACRAVRAEGVTEVRAWLGG